MSISDKIPSRSQSANAEMQPSCTDTEGRSKRRAESELRSTDTKRQKRLPNHFQNFILYKLD